MAFGRDRSGFRPTVLLGEPLQSYAEMIRRYGLIYLIETLDFETMYDTARLCESVVMIVCRVLLALYLDFRPLKAGLREECLLKRLFLIV